MPPSKPSPADRIETVSTSPTFTLSGVSEGPEGSGKTRLWLTAPDPIIAFQTDPAGMRGVVEEAAAGKDVKVFKYDFNPKAVKDEKSAQLAAVDLWGRFREEIEWAQTQCRTLFLDKEDFFWMLIRYARLPGGSSTANNYEPLYFEYRSLIYSMFEHEINFGCIRGQKEKWAQKPKPGDPTKMQGYGTGEMISRGMKEIPELLQIVFNHGWDKEEGYYVDIGKARVPGGAQGLIPRGTRLRGPEIDFATIAQLSYPDSTPEDWQ